MDIAWSRLWHSLDRAHDLHGPDRYSELWNLQGTDPNQPDPTFPICLIVPQACEACLLTLMAPSEFNRLHDRRLRTIRCLSNRRQRPRARFPRRHRCFVQHTVYVLSPPFALSLLPLTKVTFLVYENIGAKSKYTLEYPSTILACLSIVVIVPIYIFYWKGEWFRDRSKFAKELNAGRQGASERRRSSMPMKGRGGMGEKSAHMEQV